MKIINAQVFINGSFRKTEVRFNDECILEIGSDLCDDEVIDAEGNYLYPGLIDCHNHGGWFRSFMYEDNNQYGSYEERIRFILNKLPEHGVTTVMPTLAGTDYPRIARSVRELRKLRNSFPGAHLDRFQFEGIYPSLQRYMTETAVNPSLEHTDYLVDKDYSDVLMIHVSPDLPGTAQWCDCMSEKGVLTAVGNTQANAEDVLMAAEHGLSHPDHMFNGYRQMHHRENGAVAAVMYDDGIKAQLTCDGYHVSPLWVKILLKIKGLENVYGVTDMSEASGLQDGTYEVNGKTIIASDGFIYDTDGYISSGNMTANEIMRAARNRCGLSMETVASLYCENVADCLDIKDRGKIETGRMSDFTLMDHDYNVLLTIINGKVYYQK